MPDDRSTRLGTTRQLSADLRALRASAGNPSFRRMAGRSGFISHTTLHEAATGSRLPSWETVREFVRACGGDEREWRSRWEVAVRTTETRTAPATAPPADPNTGDTATPGPGVSSTGTPGQNAAAPDAAASEKAVPESAGPETTDQKTAFTETGDTKTTAPERVATEERSPENQTAESAVKENTATEKTVTENTGTANPGTANPGTGNTGAESEVADSGAPGNGDLERATAASAAELAPDLPWRVWQGRRRWLAPALGAAVITALTWLVTATDDAEVGPSYAVNEGDVAEVRDITNPDNSPVHTRQRFWKVWEITNTGSVPWQGRYLQRKNQPVGPEDCWTQERVPVGLTQPGASAEIGVPVTAPATPGFCLTEWKMVDHTGRELFPGARPVRMAVRVDP